MATTEKPSQTLNQADVAGAISSYYGVAVGHAGVNKLLEVIFPDVQSAAARDVSSWRSVFPMVLARYEKLANDLGLGITSQQRATEAALNTNPTTAGSDLPSFARAFLGRAGVPLAMSEDGEGRGARNDRASAATLAREAPLTVNGAIAYAREIGANPAFASFFVGGSHEMRDALRNAIEKGTAIADDKVKSMGDVSMIMGAIRAGRLKVDDPSIPLSVKKIIEDMRTKGVDPTTARPEEIKKYLKENPKALEGARKEIGKDKASTSKLSDQQLTDAVAKQADKVASAAKGNAPKAKTVAKTL